MDTTSHKIIDEKLKGMRTAHFTTLMEDGSIHGRPMSTQERDFDGTVWFMTSKENRVVKELSKNPKVGLLYGDPNGTKFVSLSGTAKTVDDKAKIHELWNDFYKAWFDGEDDPKINLLCVQVNYAEYWDYKGGKVGVYVDMAASAVTGKDAEGGEHQEFTF
jgi:general stress protein 26